MTSSNVNIFRVISPVCGEFMGNRWIPRTKVNDAELLWVFFICDWINGSVNNRDAGDFRRHRTHYDVTVRIVRWKAQGVTTISSRALSDTS